MSGLVYTEKGYAIRRSPFYVRTGSMFENPHGVPHSEIIQMILDNPAEVSAQTVFGKYVESSGLVFSGELIQRLFDRGRPAVIGSSFIDKEAAAQARREYEAHKFWHPRFYTGVDFARQTDYTVIFTIDTIELPARVVYYRRLNRVPWDTIYAEVGRARELFGPEILCDSTGMGGDVVMDELEGRAYCPVHKLVPTVGSVCMADHKPLPGCNPRDYLPLNCCEGYSFSQSTKKQLVDHLRIVLGAEYAQQHPDRPFGHLRCPPLPQLEEELAFYAWDDKGLQTDCVFALALAAWAGLEDPAGGYAIGSAFRGG